MFGVPYKFEINETKQIIKLRPTLGSVIAFTALSALSFVPLAVMLAIANHEPTTPTFTEDHLPETD